MSLFDSERRLKQCIDKATVNGKNHHDQAGLQQITGIFPDVACEKVSGFAHIVFLQYLT
jgi:hypothetical protein